MFAFQQAPFYDSDEKAHLGYAHEIADPGCPRSSASRRYRTVPRSGRSSWDDGP